jgi:hypothetical protein
MGNGCTTANLQGLTPPAASDLGRVNSPATEFKHWFCLEMMVAQGRRANHELRDKDAAPMGPAMMLVLCGRDVNFGSIGYEASVNHSQQNSLEFDLRASDGGGAFNASEI